MTSIFSAISGQFGRAIIIGALLPAAVFVLATHLFVVPMLPWDWRLITRVAALDPEWKVASLVVAATILAGLLYTMNTSIIRFYEGYPWQNGWLGRRRSDTYRARLDERATTAKQARELRRRLSRNKPKDARLLDLAKARDDADRAINSDFPASGSVLPTRLGNAIRAFETYSRNQYGISAIPLWPRFVARIRSDHAAAIDDAKTSFDVAVHLSFLSALTAFLMIVIAAVYPLPFATMRLFAAWAIRVVAASALSWGFYELAIDRAMAWGDLVRGVFDLYRWEVLKDLGYETRPGDLLSERALWTAISRQMIFGDPELGANLRYEPNTLVVPHNEWIRLTRAERATKSGTEISIVVENRGVDPATKIDLRERIADGSVYVAGSGRLDGTPIVVRGTNPYSFAVGDLVAGARVEVTYQLARA